VGRDESDLPDGGLAWRDPAGDERRPQRPPGPLDINRYRLETAFQGFQSFLKLPICLTPEDLKVGQVDVAICGVPFEMVVSRGGTAQAPQAIRSCDSVPVPPHERPHLSVRVDPLEVLTVVDYGDAPVTPFSIEQTLGATRAFVAEIVGADVIPIILGGDHSITYANVAAMADRFGQGTVGVVHFDAHADTAPMVFGSLYSHGTPMRRLIEERHVSGRNFVQIGLRGYWPGRDVLDWMSDQGLRTHFMAEIDKRGFHDVLDIAINEALDGTDHVFVSVDMDVLDPAFAPAVGSPEPGGLSTRELLTAIRRLAHEVGICGMDVVEVSPPYEAGNNVTALAAHRVVLEGLTGIAMRRVGILGRNYLHPEAIGESNE
jgi:formimidoylglutamase